MKNHRGIIELRVDRGEGIEICMSMRERERERERERGDTLKQIEGECVAL